MLQAKREYLARELAAIGFDVLPAQVPSRFLGFFTKSKKKPPKGMTEE